MKNVTTLELIKLDRNESTSKFIRERARTELYNRFSRYIFKFAHQYKTYSPQVSFSSLVSAGQMGLIKAINTFNTEKGTYFSTWAYSNVQQAVWHSLNEGKCIPKYYKAIGVSMSGDSEDREFDIKDENQESAFKLTKQESNRIHEILEDVLGHNVTYYCLVVSRFGLDGNKPLSNKECCEKFKGVSPSQVSAAVREFKKRAMAKYGKELTAMYVIK